MTAPHIWTLVLWFIQTATVSGTTVSFAPFPETAATPETNVADVLVAMATAASCALLGDTSSSSSSMPTHVGAACVKSDEAARDTSVLLTKATADQNRPVMAWNVDPGAATATHAGIAIINDKGAVVPVTLSVSYLQVVTICPGAMCDSAFQSDDIRGDIVPPPKPYPKEPEPVPVPVTVPEPVAGASILPALRRERQRRAKTHLELVSLRALPLYDNPEWKGAWVIPEGSHTPDGMYIPDPESSKTSNILFSTRLLAILIESIAAVGTLSARLNVIEAFMTNLYENTSLGAFRAGFPMALVVHIEWILARAPNSDRAERRAAALSAWRSAVECIVMFMCGQAAQHGISTPELPTDIPNERLNTHVTAVKGDARTWTINPWTLALTVVAERRGVIRAGCLTIAMNTHGVVDPERVAAAETWLDAVRASDASTIPGGKLDDVSDAMQRANMMWLDSIIACAQTKTQSGQVHIATKMAAESRDTYDILAHLSAKVLFVEGSRLHAPDADVEHSGVYGVAPMTFPTFASRAPPCVLSTLLMAKDGMHPRYEARKLLVTESARGNVVARAPDDRHALGIIDFLDMHIALETGGRADKLDAGMVGSIAKLSIGPPRNRMGYSCKTVQKMQRVPGRPGVGVVCPFMNNKKTLNPFDVADQLAQAVRGAQLEWPSVQAFSRAEWEEEGIGARLQAPGMSPVELCRNTVFGHDPIGKNSAFPRDIPVTITRGQM